MNSVFLEAEKVTKYYRDGNVDALNGITLSVRTGEFLVIRGPSGCGKSTLLHILGGLDTPSSGRVSIEGRPLDEAMRKPRFRARTFGVIFQMFYLWPSLNVLENVLLPLAVIGVPRALRRERVLSLLELVGVADKAKASVQSLSVGERQRVAIARALIAEPKVILADEPTGSLDSKNAENITDLLERINKEKKVTVVMVTHQAAVSASHRTIEMLDGTIRQQ